MNSVCVKNMKFLGKKTETIKLSDTRNVYAYSFLITDVTSQNLAYSLAVVYSQQLDENRNQIHDLNGFAEMFILTTMKDELEANNQRKMLVIELTNYPYIMSYFDYRDQLEFNKNTDTFSQDIVKIWSAQTPKNIPTIVVNMVCFHTGLKLIPNPFASNTEK